MTAAPRPIVVGIDGSPAAQRALRWAIAEAAVRGTTVRAVIAWKWSGPDLQGHLTVEAARAEADRILAAALREAGDTSIEYQVVEGSPARALLDAAREASLLVVGNHRHGATFRALIGSVADACLRSSPCPVVMVTSYCADDECDQAAASDQAATGMSDPLRAGHL
jgi:nucleotide-binding universal stress UspA family protein